MDGAIYDHPRFLAGGGETGKLARAHDWAATALGPPEIWPQELRFGVRLIFNAGQPMALWWGGELTRLHNDAFARMVGGARAGSAMGLRAGDGLQDVWEQVGSAVRRAQTGSAVEGGERMLIAVRDVLDRVTWLRCSISPVEGEDGRPGGVLAIFDDVTRQRTDAERLRDSEERLLELNAELARERDAARQAERRQALDAAFLQELFDQAPSYMAVLRGPNHAFQLVNPPALRLLGGRDVVGREIREVLPELESQGYLKLLDEVFASGKPFVGQGMALGLRRPPDGRIEERWLDFVLQPIKRDDAVVGVFIEGVDNTERRRADLALIEHQRRLELLNHAAARFAGQLDVGGLAQTAADAGRELTGAEVGIFRVAGGGREGGPLRVSAASGVDAVLAAELIEAAGWTAFEPLFRGEVIRIDTASPAEARRRDRRSFLAALQKELPVRSGVAAPVLSQAGRLIGALILARPAGEAFADVDEQALVVLTRQTAVAMDNASRHHAAQREILVRSEAEHQLALAIAATDLGAWDLDLTTRRLSASDRCHQMFDVPLGVEMTLADMVEMIHPEDREAVRDRFRRATDPARRDEYDIEYRIFGYCDGVERWVAARGIVVFDEEGVAVRVTGTTLDITARKRSEEHLRLLVNELNHRVKNSLAMVQAVAMQTFRNARNLDEARAAFDARLVALAKAHDVLTAENWEGADLQQVLAVVVASHSNQQSNRFELEGPEVRLSPKTAVSLSMALHELATNAVKYGALSGETGEVSVSWFKQGRRLHLTWRESGGPPVTPPTRKGFGSRLIEKGLATELGGSARVTYHPQGVECVLEAPIAEEG